MLFFPATMSMEQFWSEIIDEERTRPGSYVLNGIDRKYCVTGNRQDSYAPSKLRSRIKEDRLQQLPLRFQDLFDDIGLVNYADDEFLSDTEREELWEEILNTETRVSTTGEHSSYAAKPRPAAFDFGVELGAIMRNLRAGTGSTADELIWGFILGLIDNENEEKQLNVLMTKLREKRKNRGDLLERQESRQELTKEVYEDQYRLLRQYLESKGFDIDTFPIRVDRLTMHLDLTPFPSDIPELEEKLDDVLDFDQLERLVELKRIVETDINNNFTSFHKGEEGVKILGELWRRSKLNKSKRVGVKNLDSIINQNPGRKLLNDYAGKRDEIAQFPFIDKQNDNCRLTAYGRVVSYCYFDNNKGCNWILKHNIVTDQDGKHAALAQLSGERQSLLEDVEDEIDMDELV